MEQTVYFEDFENGPGGWSTGVPIGVKWHVTTHDDGSGPRGIWWVGEDNSHWAGGGGYGNSWNQALTKTFTLGSGPITLTLDHQYDTETYYDFCYVYVSTDGGANFWWQAQFTGNSGGYTTDTVDLSWAAGQTVQVRLEFISDIAWSDEDGLNNSDGGWRIDRVQVTGFPADDFETGGDGWLAEDLPGYTAEAPISLRLELDPPCDPSLICLDYDHSWVAYDPSLGRVPLASASGNTILPVLDRMASPDIPVPAGVDQVFLDFDLFDDVFVDFDQATVSGYLFGTWKIVNTFSDGSERRDGEATLFYTAGGWRHMTRDLTPFIDPGAVSFRVELSITEGTAVLEWTYGLTIVNHDQMGPWFDNVRISTLTNVEDVNVTGTVSGCEGPLAGVTVDLDHPDGTMYTTSTDASGSYAFPNVSATLDDAVVAIVVPLGYAADTPSPAQALVPLSGDQTVDFLLSCLEPEGEARSMGYWKHQANVYLNNKGNAQESQTDMETAYPEAIFNHFYENGLNAIQVDGVTFMDDGSGGDVPLDLGTVHATLSVKGNAGMEAKAKQQYLAFLLNIASGKLLTSSVISDDGGTASQAVQQVAAAINDGDPANDEAAKDICDTINNAQLVGAGVIDLGLQTIAYSNPIDPVQLTTALLGAAPNPFRAGTSIRFSLKEPGEVRVAIYDISGRLVRSVFDRWAEAGPHDVSWDGSDRRGNRVASGIYYIQMVSRDFAATKRAVFVR